MNINWDGRPIKTIRFPCGSTISSRDGHNLWFSYTYHGDRDKFWVIEELEGVEFARHNPKYIESIYWEREGVNTAIREKYERDLYPADEGGMDYRGTLEEEYDLYLALADDGQGGDITRNGEPLLTFEEWLER